MDLDAKIKALKNYLNMQGAYREGIYLHYVDFIHNLTGAHKPKIIYCINLIFGLHIPHDEVDKGDIDDGLISAIKYLIVNKHITESSRKNMQAIPEEDVLTKEKIYLRNAFETSNNKTPFKNRSRFINECVKKVQEFYKFDYYKAELFVKLILGIDQHFYNSVVKTLFEFVQCREKESEMNIIQKLYFIREHHSQSPTIKHNLAYSVYNKLLSDSFGYDYYKSRDIVELILGNNECNENGCIELIYHYIKKTGEM